MNQNIQVQIFLWIYINTGISVNESKTLREQKPDTA